MNNLIFIWVVGGIGVFAGLVFFFSELRKLRVVQRRFEQADESFMVLGDGADIFTHEQWINFEATVPGLRQVIVVSDRVQDPQDALRAAVMTNFKRGVRYSFLVSHSKGHQELDGYINMFVATAKVAIRDFRLDVPADELVKILALPIEWNNPPFVFYRASDDAAATTDDSSATKTIAFRGDKANVGIANRYVALDPFVADALATALYADAPEEMKIELQEFYQDSFKSIEAFEKVVSFPGTR